MLASEFTKMCDRLEFQTPAEFQGWRSSQKFRAFSLDKDEAERACIAMYVNALIQISHNLVAWPVIITKSESPDFKLRFGNNPEIGVEHSTITSTKYQQFRAESLRDPEDSVVFLDSFKLGGPPENNHNAGWVGKEAEREWSTLALLRTKAKLDKLNRSHFLKNARNELLLNTVSYLPNLDIQTAIRMFADQLSQEIETRKRQHLFDAISIIYGSTTIPQALVKQIR